MRPTVLATPDQLRSLNARRAQLFAAALSIIVRGYVGFVWLKFAIMKIQQGWLTSNPIRPLMTMIGAGQLPTTAPGYGLVARMLVFTHADAVMSVAIPCMELALGLAFIIGVRLRVAAVVATAMNVNLLLAGIASLALDGRMIVLQLMLIALTTLAPRPSRHIFRAWRKSFLRKSSGSSRRTGSRRSLAS